MALTDFFRINMPYGIVRNSKGEWTAFNREYAPIGWNQNDPLNNLSSDDTYSDLPIRTKYKNVTEKILQKLIDSEDQVRYDTDGSIREIWLYNDSTNPTNNAEYWNSYLDKIKILSTLKTHF